LSKNVRGHLERERASVCDLGSLGRHKTYPYNSFAGGEMT
jgi:hypothetical protein